MQVITGRICCLECSKEVWSHTGCCWLTLLPN